MSIQTLAFNVSALIADPVAGAIFNRVQDAENGLFSYDSTYNGIMIQVASNDPDVGLWDVTATVNTERRVLEVHGYEFSCGQGARVSLYINAEGEIVEYRVFGSLANKSFGAAIPELKIVSMEVEPMTLEAYNAIKSVFGSIVS
jgi:hypothetical protein